MFENDLSLDTFKTSKITKICRRLNTFGYIYLLPKAITSVAFLDVPIWWLIFSKRFCHNLNSTNNTDFPHSFKSTMYFCTRHNKCPSSLSIEINDLLKSNCNLLWLTISNQIYKLSLTHLESVVGSNKINFTFAVWVIIIFW